MGLIKFASRNKYLFFCILLFIYVSSSLLEGERGLISFYEKQKIKKELLEEKFFLTSQLLLVENKNKLLNENIDLDYLEILYRKKFMLGKDSEQIFYMK